MTAGFPKDFDIVDPQGRFICQGKTQMNGARLSVASLYNGVLLNNLGLNRPLTSGDIIVWDVKGKEFVIQDVHPRPSGTQPSIAQYWDFVDCLGEVLKLVRYLQQSDILVFKKETGKPKRWQKYRESKKLNGKEREHSEVSKDDGVGIFDLLGNYSSFETTIRIYPEAVQECADDFGFNQTDLTHLVILHELGHAFVHLGASGNAVHSAYDLVECNRFWVQLEFFGRSEIHEFLAQSFTWIAVNDPIIRKKHPNLSGIFSKLIQSQPEDYKLWGRQNRPNDEQAWQAWLTRARVALDEPSHWENCLRQIRDLMPANLDAAIKLFIK